MDSLKKLAIAVIVLVVGVVALSIYIVNREAKIGKQAQTIERLNTSVQSLTTTNSAMLAEKKFYNQQVQKLQEELKKIKKIEIKKNATGNGDDLIKALSMIFDYE